MNNTEYSIAQSAWREDVPESHTGELSGSASYVASGNNVIFNLFSANVRICTTTQYAIKSGYHIKDNSEGTIVPLVLKGLKLVQSDSCNVTYHELEASEAFQIYNEEYKKCENRDFVLQSNGAARPPSYGTETPPTPSVLPSYIDAATDPPPEIENSSPAPQGRFARLIARIRNRQSRSEGNQR